MSLQVLREGASSLKDLLRQNYSYALIGGGAVILLGSPGGTKDFDIVVLSGQKIAVIQQLTQNSNGAFKHTLDGCVLYYGSDDKCHNVDVMEENEIDGDFSSQTPVVLYSGAIILEVPSLLELKCVT
jgi:hypothetical protein